MHLTYRKTCRACGSSALTPVIDIGLQYLQGSFVLPGKEDPSSRRIPCRLVRCNPEEDENACGLLQMETSVPPEILYAAYWYRSGTNQTMRDHLQGIVTEITEWRGTPETALDIGCNDGTLLGFYPDEVKKYGVDPSDVAATIGGDVSVFVDTFPSERLEQAVGEESLDVITSIAMFYDLEEPVEFVRRISRLLKMDGLWVFEMSYLPAMLENDSYDTICHEHLEYYSLAVIEKILKMGGMRPARVSLNSSNGGSIRVFAEKAGAEHDGSRDRGCLDELRSREFDMMLDTDAPYVEFQERIEAHREELTALLREIKGRGESIHIYGASTKGNTILQWCGIDHTLIDCAADRNPDKHGARTLGSDIPIVSEEESRGLSPDYYLVLPWHFREEFLKRESAMLEAGTKLIFPLPKLEVVGG